MAITGGRPPSDQDWQDLLAKTARPGVYGVRTTGIYCRFGCPSRLPLRQNTLVFDSRDQAEAAGLRPCKRCAAQ